jgi:hypothetical protein
MGSSGWAFVFGRKRLAQEVILKVLLMTGTLFYSVEKKLNESPLLILQDFIQIPEENSPNTAEVTELTSENTIPIGVFRKVRRECQK